MATIFTKIVNREIPAHIVAETNHFLAFLDINPLVMGHVLVIPKKEVDYIFDLDSETLSGLMEFAKKVSSAIREAVPCLRIGVAVIGIEVPHCHIHLIPLNSMNDINFTRPKLKPTDDELAEIASKIKSNLN
ncbi:MAG TPA: HIT family protein [Cyclobacteriaceae bacterium]